MSLETPLVVSLNRYVPSVSPVTFVMAAEGLMITCVPGPLTLAHRYEVAPDEALAFNMAVSGRIWFM